MQHIYLPNKFVSLKIFLIILGLIPQSMIYSSLPEYPAACRRDEWQGEPRRSSLERRRVGYGAIPLDTPPLAVGSFIRRFFRYHA
jgi:hypothetical protein